MGLVGLFLRVRRVELIIVIVGSWCVIGLGHCVAMVALLAMCGVSELCMKCEIRNQEVRLGVGFVWCNRL